MPASAILEPSGNTPTFVTFTDPIGQVQFETDTAALQFLASQFPHKPATLETPLAVPMLGTYRPQDGSRATTQSGDRPAQDFRILMTDREILAGAYADRDYTVLPYMLLNGITSLALNVGEQAQSLEARDVWLNIVDAEHPPTKRVDAMLQIMLWGEGLPADALIEQHEARKAEVGRILERIVNVGTTPIG